MPKRSAIDERLFVASVEKATTVLEAFDEGAPKLSLSELSRRTGLGRSAVQQTAGGCSRRPRRRGD
jgi:hypothetical protein